MLMQHQSKIVEPFGSLHLCPVVATLLRNNIAPRHYREVGEFLLEKPTWKQLRLLLTHIGAASLDKIVDMQIEAAVNGVVHAKVKLTSGTQWLGYMLQLEGSMPETLAASAQGRRLGDIVSHALLPAEAIIQNVVPATSATHIYLEMPAQSIPTP